MRKLSDILGMTGKQFERIGKTPIQFVMERFSKIGNIYCPEHRKTAKICGKPKIINEYSFTVLLDCCHKKRIYELGYRHKKERKL